MRFLALLLLLPIVFSYNCPSIITTRNVTIPVDDCDSSFYSISPPSFSHVCMDYNLNITFNHSGTYNITMGGNKCTIDVFIGENRLPVPDTNPIISIIVVLSTIFLAQNSRRDVQNP